MVTYTVGIVVKGTVSNKIPKDTLNETNLFNILTKKMKNYGRRKSESRIKKSSSLLGVAKTPNHRPQTGYGTHPHCRPCTLPSLPPLHRPPKTLRLYNHPLLTV